MCSLWLTSEHSRVQISPPGAKTWTNNAPVHQQINGACSKSTFIGFFRIYRKRLVLLILVTTMRSIMTIIGADDARDTDLFLEELVAHGKEGDGQARAKEKDEVGRQLIPVFSSCIFG